VPATDPVIVTTLLGSGSSRPISFKATLTQVMISCPSLLANPVALPKGCSPLKLGVALEYFVNIKNHLNLRVSSVVFKTTLG